MKPSFGPCLEHLQAMVGNLDHHSLLSQKGLVTALLAWALPDGTQARHGLLPIAGAISVADRSLVQGPPAMQSLPPPAPSQASPPSLLQWCSCSSGHRVLCLLPSKGIGLPPLRKNSRLSALLNLSRNLLNRTSLCCEAGHHHIPFKSIFTEKRLIFIKIAFLSLSQAREPRGWNLPPIHHNYLGIIPKL